MHIQVDGERILLALDQDEAKRLGVALAAGYESVSRAEYFIRTGLAEPTIREIATVLVRDELEDGTIVLPLENGVEAMENPRRPRPTS